MKIRVVVDIDVAFSGTGSIEVNASDIKSAVESAIITEDLPELLAADISEVSAYDIEALSVNVDSIEIV